jgi:hypothetical protein
LIRYRACHALPFYALQAATLETTLQLFQGWPSAGPGGRPAAIFYPTPYTYIFTFTYPYALSASSTSIPSRTYKGIHDALTVIAKEEGVAALYSGTLPSLVLVLNPAIHWMCYEFLKSHCQRMYGDGR